MTSAPILASSVVPVWAHPHCVTTTLQENILKTMLSDTNSTKATDFPKETVTKRVISQKMGFPGYPQ